MKLYLTIKSIVTISAFTIEDTDIDIQRDPYRGMLIFESNQIKPTKTNEFANFLNPL